MAKSHHHRGEHGHHTPEHHGGHGSKAPKSSSGEMGSTTGKPYRGNHVMKDGGGDSHVHPDHTAANKAFGMHEGFAGGEAYMQGHDEEANECGDCE
jgi:hypothetical protein